MEEVASDDIGICIAFAGSDSCLLIAVWSHRFLLSYIIFLLFFILYYCCYFNHHHHHQFSSVESIFFELLLRSLLSLF